MRTKWSTAVSYLLLVVVAAACWLPFQLMAATSFTPSTFTLPYPPKLWPASFDLANYTFVMTTERFALKFLNSVIVTAATTVLTLFLAVLTAYGFERFRFRGKELLFQVFLFTLMVPAALTIIPQFLLLKQLGLSATHPGLVLLYVAGGVVGSTFFLRGYLRSIPRELDESIFMDGGTRWTVFTRIIVPMAQPALATMAIFTLQGTWEEFFTAKVVLGANEQLHTLPVMVQRLFDKNATQWGAVFAAAMLMLIPVLALYVVFQKKFVVEGLTQGAVKQ